MGEVKSQYITKNRDKMINKNLVDFSSHLIILKRVISFDHVMLHSREKLDNIFLPNASFSFSSLQVVFPKWFDCKSMKHDAQTSKKKVFSLDAKQNLCVLCPYPVLLAISLIDDYFVYCTTD